MSGAASPVAVHLGLLRAFDRGAQAFRDGKDMESSSDPDQSNSTWQEHLEFMRGWVCERTKASASPARRYPVEKKGDVTHYGPWRISFYAPPIPSRNCDWHWQHDDFDGSPDAEDNRGGACASLADALNACDAFEDDNA